MQTFDDVWAAIFAAKTVYWMNRAYRVHPVEVLPAHKPPHQRDGLALRVTYFRPSEPGHFFGSFLEASEITNLFTEEGTP